MNPLRFLKIRLLRFWQLRFLSVRVLGVLVCFRNVTNVQTYNRLGTLPQSLPNFNSETRLVHRSRHRTLSRSISFVDAEECPRTTPTGPSTSFWRSGEISVYVPILRTENPKRTRLTVLWVSTIRSVDQRWDPVFFVFDLILVYIGGGWLWFVCDYHY